MVMADANTMIRCIIGDDEEKIHELQKIRSEQEIVYTLEVIAEVVYVLTKVYQVSREEDKKYSIANRRASIKSDMIPLT